MPKTQARTPCPLCQKPVLSVNSHKRLAHPLEYRASPPVAVAEAPAPTLASGVRPGSVVGEALQKQKLPYTLQWFKDNYPMVTFMPNETIDVTVQGVSIRLIALVDNTVPSIFRDVYMESLRERRSLSNWRQPGDAIGVQVAVGAGPMPMTATEVS